MGSGRLLETDFAPELAPLGFWDDSVWSRDKLAITSIRIRPDHD
jgi:hypothetical protein